MTSCLARRHSPRRYVRLVLEELEWRHVPSLLGLQIELPLSGLLPPLTLSVGGGATATPSTTTTATPSTTTTPTPTTTSPSPTSASFSPTPSTQSNIPTSVSIIFVNAGASQQPTPTSSESGAGALSGGDSSASSSPTFNEGASQGSGSTFVVPFAVTPGLGIQAAQTGSSNVLGGTVSGINFELLGNLPTLLGPSNILQGTVNTSVSATQPIGASFAGSVLGRPDLFADHTPGSTAAFGLTHTPPEEREEPLPENPPTPPNDDWWVSVPKTRDQMFPTANVLLRERIGLPSSDVPISPERPLPVDAQSFEGVPLGVPQSFLFSEDDVGMPADEDQPEEQSGIPAAIAILSCAVGVYWAPRFRSFRRVAAVLPMNGRDV